MLNRLPLFLLLVFACPALAQEPKIIPPQVYQTGYVPPTPERRRELYESARRSHGYRLAMQAQFQALPAAFDCRDKGWVLPVGDQANCGSCYLYSTVYGTLTQAFVKAGYGKPDGSLVMSVQFGMDCHDFGGCNGGNGTEVIDWVCKNGWPAEKWVDLDGKPHNDYPAYEARSRTCRKVPGAKVWTPAAWGFATGDQSNRPATVAEIKTAMFNYGPLNVALDAGGQFGNGTGTITALGTNIDHEIEKVAWDDNHDNGDGTKGAFLLKNQWTKDWGVKGYRWLAYHAANRVVDVFWISVNALPPPPTPPVPPGPVPPSPSTIIGTGRLANGTLFEMVTPGTKIAFDDREAKLVEIRRLLDAIQSSPNPAPQPQPQPVEVIPKQLPKGDPLPPVDDARKEELRKLNEQIKKLEETVKMLEGKKQSKVTPKSALELSWEEEVALLMRMRYPNETPMMIAQRVRDYAAQFPSKP